MQYVVYNKYNSNTAMSFLNTYQLFFMMAMVMLAYLILKENPKKIFKGIFFVIFFCLLQIGALNVFKEQVKDCYIKLDYRHINSTIQNNLKTENITKPLYVEFKNNMESNNEDYLIEFSKKNNIEHFMYVSKDKVDELLLLNKVTSNQDYKDLFKKIYVNGKITQYDYDDFKNYLNKSENNT